MPEQKFCHLHTHSEYSLLDGACRIKELVRAVKDKGMDTIAITDHGVMYGVIGFYDECIKNGIKPIIGCEIYTAAHSRFDKTQEFDYKNGHLILLAENNTGYHNLIKIVSEAFTNGFYRKPRADIELLREYHDGLIALSGCMAGDVQRAILDDDYDKAREYAFGYRKIFGDDNFYLELQDHKTDEDKKIIAGLIRLSKDTKIPLVATNDVHYIEKDDAFIQKVLTSIQTNTNIHENGFGFKTNEFYLKTPGEMSELFSYASEAVANTALIAGRCSVTIEYGKLHLPEFRLPDEVKDKYNAKEYLKYLCKKGLVKRYGNKDNLERLNYELGVIDSMGFNDYFLIVYDFVRYAKINNIPVGPGRGSAAGSIVSYCLGITDIDPIRFGLLFERFLNPERVSMPDIDIDFCNERRSEVIDYVISKYGSERVAQIITFGTMAAKAAVRDVGRALDMPYGYVDSIAKLIPFGIGMTIDKAMNDESVSNPKLLEMYNSDADAKKLIDTAKKLEGMPRHASTHAAGVVICARNVSDYVPLAKNDDFPVTQYTMTELERLGLLKMDFLGLRYLTVVHKTQELIKKKDKNFSLKTIDYNDKKSYDLLSSGKTDGLFQLESAGMRSLLMQFKPEKLDDITAIIALYRPGPMQFIPQYLESRQHPEKVKYKHELLKDILRETYGCIVYQEQVMIIVQKLAGFTLGQADLLRRAMSKKKLDEMNKQRGIFLYGGEVIDKNGNKTICDGAIKRGVDETTANEIFDQMTDFANYAFNKSHAASYAALAYQTTYLKANYPREYMANLLSSVRDNIDKVEEYVSCLDGMNIKFLPPSINHSSNDFVAVPGGIEFSLSAIKNIGTGIIEKLVYERERGGEFHDIYDFCRRMNGSGINKKAIESLIKAGAFDNLGSEKLNRRTLLMNYDAIFDSINEDKNTSVAGQMDLFNMNLPDNEKNEFKQINIQKYDEYPEDVLAQMEKDITGMYITGHPLKKYKEIYAVMGATAIDKISGIGGTLENYDERSINVLGIISDIKVKKTKRNENMCLIYISDFTGSVDCLIFPKLYRTNTNIKAQDIVYITGRVQKEDDITKILCTSIKKIEKSELDNKLLSAGNIKKLYITIRNDEHINKLMNILKKSNGSDEVFFYIEKNKQWQKINYKVNVLEIISKIKQIISGKDIIIK